MPKYSAARSLLLASFLLSTAIGACASSDATDASFDAGASPPSTTPDAAIDTAAPPVDATTPPPSTDGAPNPLPSPDAASLDTGLPEAAPIDAAPYPCPATNNVATLTRGNLGLTVDLSAGSATFSYGGAPKITDFYAGVQLASYTTSKVYTSRTCVVAGATLTVTSTGASLPTMTQSYTLEGPNHLLAQVTVTGSGLSSNWIAPIVVDTAGGVDVGSYADSRILWVPFDNDAWVSYNALPMTASGTSYEAAAFYDNTSRNGIVVGSVTHDTWKSGVYYVGGGTKLNAMNVFGGAVNPTWTHDPLPHGKVTGDTIASPVMFAGYASDWRDLLEEYGDANAAHAPKLAWTGGVPFGWNSWDKIGTGITHDKAVAVSDFIHSSLEPAFTSPAGTVYVNLDSYWDNLSSTELADFVTHVHANGQKAGIYWTPWVDWGENASRAVEGTTGTTYGSIWLRDASNNPIALDGAYAVDPTNPATKARIDYFTGEFKAWGFDYVKLDFLSHGALESTVRSDPTVTTGIAAYNQGMQYLLGRIGGTMFVSESIAPLFPAQYAHARRLSCDVNGAAVDSHGASYELNSLTYGWWMSGRTYAYDNPDMVQLEGYTASDNMTRLLSAVVSGTVFLDGDDLTESTGQSLARAYLTVPRINAVAAIGRPFRPVEGNTGTGASSTFVLTQGATTYLAVFNLTSAATTQVVDLGRAGLDTTKTYSATDLWSGTSAPATGTMSVPLAGGFGRLFSLE